MTLEKDFLETLLTLYDFQIRLLDRGSLFKFNRLLFVGSEYKCQTLDIWDVVNKARCAMSTLLDVNIWNLDGCELSESYLGLWNFGDTGQMFNVFCLLVWPLGHVVRLFCGMS